MWPATVVPIWRQALSSKERKGEDAGCCCSVCINPRHPGRQPCPRLVRPRASSTQSSPWCSLHSLPSSNIFQKKCFESEKQRVTWLRKGWNLLEPWLDSSWFIMFALSQVHFLVNRSHFRVSHHFARLQWLAPSRPWQGHGIQASRGLADGSDVTGTEKTRLFGNLDAGTTKSRDGSTKWCPKYLQMVITMRIWGLLSDNPKMCATFGWPDDVGVGWFDRKITHDEFGRWFRVDLTSEFQWRLYDDRLWDTQSVKVYLDISRLISSGTSPPISTYLSTYIIYI